MEITRETLLKTFSIISTRKINIILKNCVGLKIEDLKCLNPKCNNIRKWKGNTGLAYCCSKECFKETKDIIDSIKSKKIKETYLERTGFEHPALNPEIKQKKKETYLAKTGYENPAHNKEVIQKRKETYYNKTGYFNSSQNPEVQQRKKETYFNKTGFEYPGQNPDVQLKKKETYLARTGFESPLHNPLVHIKGKKNYFKRTGFYHNSYNPEVKEKQKQTKLKKYGTTSNSNQHITNFEQWNDKQFWIDNFITDNNNFDYIKCMDYFNCGQVATHQKIKEFGIFYSKIGGTSLKEQALYPFLDELGFIYETNVRNVIDNLELDIFFPELDLAIEYNGLYWHSYHEAIGTSPKQLDLNYMKYRHQVKSLACLDKGIRLLHIYEDTENIENLILDFLNYEACNQEGSLKEPNSYELDSGCYPLLLEYEAMEPESRIVLEDRLLFNAGKIKGNL